MSDWIEFEIGGEAGDASKVEWISVKNKDVEYFASGESHTIQYPTSAAASEAYLAFIALVSPPVNPDHVIAPGDIVRMSRPLGTGGDHIRTAPLTVVAIPKKAGDCYVLQDAATTFFVFEPVIFSKAVV